MSYPNLFRLKLLEFPTATRRTRECYTPLENTMRFSWSSFPMWSCFLLAILASLSLAKTEEEDATMLQRQVHRERANEANEAKTPPKTPPGLDHYILGQILRCLSRDLAAVKSLYMFFFSKIRRTPQRKSSHQQKKHNRQLTQSPEKMGDSTIFVKMPFRRIQH